MSKKDTIITVVAIILVLIFMGLLMYKYPDFFKGLLTSVWVGLGDMVEFIFKMLFSLLEFLISLFK